MAYSQQISPAATRFVFLVLVVFLFPISPRQLEAWSYHTHRKIVSDALSFMPTAFQERFRPFKERMMEGSTDPDSLLKDFMNHVYHVNGSIGRDSVVRITDLFREAAEQLKRGTIDVEAAYTMGLLAHYVADINQPLHTAGSESDYAESDYHGSFEKDVQRRMTKIPVPVPVSYAPVTDPGQRIREMAETAFRQYERIGTAYRSGRGIYDLDDVVNAQYAAAVRNVADFWLGIAGQGGMQIQAAPPAAPIVVSDAASRAAGVAEIALSLEGPAQVFPASKPAVVDINTATYDQLTGVRGIGPKRANAIIAARRKGPFRSITDLAGIIDPISGKKVFSVTLIERLSELLTAR